MDSLGEKRRGAFSRRSQTKFDSDKISRQIFKLIQRGENIQRTLNNVVNIVIAILGKPLDRRNIFKFRQIGGFSIQIKLVAKSQG